MSTTKLARCAVLGLAIAAAACGRRTPNLAHDPSGAGTSAGDNGANGGDGGGDGDGDDNRDGGGGAGDAGGALLDAGDAASPDPIGPRPEPGVEVSGDPPAGIWIGQLTGVDDSAFFPCAPASRRVTLQIVAARAGERAQGTIIFGDNTPPPPVEDASSEYPPGIALEEARCRTMLPMDGFAYTLREGVVGDDGRFDFRVSVVEPYMPWCSMQTHAANPHSPTGYLCLPPGTPGSYGECMNDPSCTLSETEYELCSETGVCDCYRQGCEAKLNRTYRFALQVMGAAIRGVVSTLSSELGSQEVSLRKVE